MSNKENKKEVLHIRYLLHGKYLGVRKSVKKWESLLEQKQSSREVQQSRASGKMREMIVFQILFSEITCKYAQPKAQVCHLSDTWARTDCFISVYPGCHSGSGAGCAEILDEEVVWLHCSQTHWKVNKYNRHTYADAWPACFCCN